MKTYRIIPFPLSRASHDMGKAVGGSPSGTEETPTSEETAECQLTLTSASGLAYIVFQKRYNAVALHFQSNLILSYLLIDYALKFCFLVKDFG